MRLNYIAHIPGITTSITKDISIVPSSHTNASGSKREMRSDSFALTPSMRVMTTAFYAKQQKLTRGEEEEPTQKTMPFQKERSKEIFRK